MKTTLFRASIVLSTALLAGACVPSSPLSSRTCPCQDGWICCRNDICEPDISMCPPYPTADEASSTDAGLAGAPSAGDASTKIPPPRPVEPAYANPEAVLGTWTGYQENLMIYGASDVVTLRLTQAADGTGAVSVVFGTATAPPRATDPDLYWPPARNNQVAPQIEFVVEGFAYPGHRVAWAGQRLKFNIDKNEPWEPWCELQTSYPVEESTGVVYLTVPRGGGGGALGGGPNDCYAGDAAKQTQVSCASFWDGDKCTCIATGCGADYAWGGPSFDITFDGDTARGTANVYGALDVMLTRTGN